MPFGKHIPASRQLHVEGGWTVDYAGISPPGALDWRGYTTVCAVDILRRNNVIAASPS